MTVDGVFKEIGVAANTAVGVRRNQNAGAVERPDETLRHKIFVDNPARLFGWD